MSHEQASARACRLTDDGWQGKAPDLALGRLEDFASPFLAPQNLRPSTLAVLRGLCECADAVILSLSKDRDFLSG